MSSLVIADPINPVEPVTSFFILSNLCYYRFSPTYYNFLFLGQAKVVVLSDCHNTSYLLHLQYSINHRPSVFLHLLKRAECDFSIYPTARYLTPDGSSNSFVELDGSQ